MIELSLGCKINEISPWKRAMVSERGSEQSLRPKGHLHGALLVY